MSYFTYILYSEKYDRYYIGQTQDLDNRLEAHNSGHSKSTMKYTPWKLFWKEEFNTRSEAMARERKLKNLKSRKKRSEYMSSHGLIIDL